MNELVRCREMASLCRQRSAFYHDEKWAWLAKAKMWDALGDQEIEHHQMAAGASSAAFQDELKGATAS